MPHVRDELRYMQRLDQIQDPAMETLTFRRRPYRPLLLPRWLDSPPSLRIPMKSPGHSEMMSRCSDMMSPGVRCLAGG
jgi:hypothetical protein